MASYEKYTLRTGETRWRVTYRKPDGSQTTKRGFRRKRDAETWAAEHVVIASATNTFIDPSAGNLTVGELYERWFDVMRPLWKPTYRHGVAVAWATHCRDVWARRKIASITCGELQAWVSGIAARRSASTTSRAFGVMNGVLGYAVKEKRLPSNPCDDVRLPARPKRKERRVYLTMGQLLDFADECGRGEELGADRRALILTLGLCGLRWGEAAALRVRDVDLKRRRLHIVSSTSKVDGEIIDGTPKNGRGRDVVMPRVVLEAVGPIVVRRRETDGDDARVFVDRSGAPLRPQSASSLKRNRTWWPSALRRLGWPAKQWPSPHDLRHTAASLAVHAGANVKALQRMLGHSSAAMTLDVYADLFDSDLDDVADALDRVAGDAT
ncbi:site-specific integrase [Bifidobacterium callitrichos]|uniref:Phage integrase family protein n=1 Tax=Bifidobacterium callitrichos DSM 23973 TaxID=1437609 RepID=A0A086ZY50_9BIFI|nr:site-specific integrase [Bifidobacterium callitrichos]KFI51450.1 phage integrase family protein [Bifidobacterium callitrichos DSM 23973]